MTDMLRPTLRILSLIGLALLVGTALIAQLRPIHLALGTLQIAIAPATLELSRSGWTFYTPYTPAIFHADYFQLPSFERIGSDYFYYLPWWLVLATWGIVIAIVWRLTRSPKVRRAFPIEPSPKSAQVSNDTGFNRRASVGSFLHIRLD